MVVKSTVVPGTTDDVVLPMLEQASGKRAGVDFGVGMNPEFLTEGVAVDDFMQPDRIVIGGIDERSHRRAARGLRAFAEHADAGDQQQDRRDDQVRSNSVLATMISFSNEIGNLCDALGGVDVADVMRGVHLARYFTTHAATTASASRRRSRSFLWAGCGYGGSCLPKDTKALSAHGAAHGQPMPLLDA